MDLFTSFVILLFGLAIGSFLAALSYRLPRGKKISDGRSFCDRCKKTLSWFDNIPVFSFIALKGKSRCCGRKISVRYPIIEVTTAVLFLAVYYFQSVCRFLNSGSDTNKAICYFDEKLGYIALPYFLILAAILITIFIIDYEKQIIPDELSLLLYILAYLGIIIAGPNDFFLRMFVSFIPAGFLLLLHVITKGKGMGLGDVKLVLFGGLLFSWQMTLLWMSLSFVIGAIVGIVLILAKKTDFGRKIAFGPFIIISFLLTFIFGDKIIMITAPYLL